MSPSADRPLGGAAECRSSAGRRRASAFAAGRPGRLRTRAGRCHHQRQQQTHIDSHAAPSPRFSHDCVRMLGMNRREFLGAMAAAPLAIARAGGEPGRGERSRSPRSIELAEAHDAGDGVGAVAAGAAGPVSDRSRPHARRQRRKTRVVRLPGSDTAIARRRVGPHDAAAGVRGDR